MNSQGNPGLTPQEEEGITEVKFAGLDWFDSEEFKTYASIRDIINQAKSMPELEIQ
jgi:hypothetical protein